MQIKFLSYSFGSADSETDNSVYDECKTCYPQGPGENNYYHIYGSSTFNNDIKSSLSSMDKKRIYDNPELIPCEEMPDLMDYSDRDRAVTVVEKEEQSKIITFIDNLKIVRFLDDMSVHKKFRKEFNTSKVSIDIIEIMIEEYYMFSFNEDEDGTKRVYQKLMDILTTDEFKDDINMIYSSDYVKYSASQDTLVIEEKFDKSKKVLNNDCSQIPMVSDTGEAVMVVENHYENLNTRFVKFGTIVNDLITSVKDKDYSKFNGHYVKSGDLIEEIHNGIEKVGGALNNYKQRMLFKLASKYGVQSYIGTKTRSSGFDERSHQGSCPVGYVGICNTLMNVLAIFKAIFKLLMLLSVVMNYPAFCVGIAGALGLTVVSYMLPAIFVTMLIMSIIATIGHIFDNPNTFFGKLRKLTVLAVI